MLLIRQNGPQNPPKNFQISSNESKRLKFYIYLMIQRWRPYKILIFSGEFNYLLVFILINVGVYKRPLKSNRLPSISGINDLFLYDTYKANPDR